jgi:hypothetical protein
MPTPAEQKALAFVALVVLLGGVVRVVRGGVLAPSAPTPAEQQAIARQAFAASSSAAGQAATKDGKTRKSRKLARSSGDGVVSSAAIRAQPSGLDARGFPPPGPRIDMNVWGQQAALGPVGLPARRPAPGLPAGPIDLDTAAEPEIEALPRVGPALARRIVANRDSAGPFGNIQALRRVRGIGPATLELLTPLVTFSGQKRR